MNQIRFYTVKIAANRASEFEGASMACVSFWGGEPRDTGRAHTACYGLIFSPETSGDDIERACDAFEDHCQECDAVLEYRRVEEAAANEYAEMMG